MSISLSNAGDDSTRAVFWQTIFSVLGPFDLYGATGNDPLLRGRRELVVQIFRLVDYPENLEVSVAAMHAIADIAESPVFASASPHSPHKLYSILEAAGELSNVMDSFVRRLEREETEQASLLTAEGLHALDRGPHGEDCDADRDAFIPAFGLANLIRLQIADFLTRNAAKPGYNLAHYLLGFGPELLSSPASSIAPPSDTAPFTCLHLVLEMLAYGLGHPSTCILALDHPSFGHRCFELIATLLANPAASRATVNYLRDHEDFYRKQLAFFARDPVDTSDPGYTVFEICQKSALFKGAMLDLHMALAEGAWSYARKLTKVIVLGVLDGGRAGEGDGKEKGEGREKGEGALDAGYSLLGQHLSPLLDLLAPPFLLPLAPALQSHLLQATDSLLRSASKLSQLMVIALDRIPYDRPQMLALQSHLVTSLVPIIGKFLASSSATPAVLETLASLAITVVAFLRRAHSEASSGVLAGDELASLCALAINGLLRSDATISTRGYLYSIFCDSVDLLRLDAAGIAAVKTLAKKEMPRLLEVAAGDAVLPAVDAAGWKTMAATFLHSFTSLLDKEGLALPVLERLARLGSIKSLVSSLRSDDRALLVVLEPSCHNLNPLYLWQSKLILLEKLAVLALGSERLVEAGLMDVLSGLGVWEWQGYAAPSATGKPNSIVEHRWHQLATPIVRLLLLLATDPSPAVRTAVTLFVAANSPALEAVLRPKGALPTSHEHLQLVTLAAALIAQTFHGKNRQVIFVSRASRITSQAFHQIFASLLAKALGFLAGREDAKADAHIVGILESSVHFFHSEMLADPHLILVGFGEESVEAMARAGAVPINILARVLEWAVDQHILSSGGGDAGLPPTAHRLLTTVERLLLAVLLSVERHASACKDRAALARDLRILSSGISPALEQLANAEKTGESKEKSPALERLIRELRHTIAPPDTDASL